MESVFVGMFLIVSAIFLAGGLAATHGLEMPKAGLLAGLGHIVGKGLPAGVIASYRRMLALAGTPKKISVDALLGLKVVIGLLGIFLIALLFYLASRPVATALPIALLGGAVFVFLPDLWLSNRGTRRQSMIRRELPDVLDLLTIAVEAGLGFDAALKRLVESVNGPLSEEFSRLLREMQLGRARGEALKALLERTNVSELNAFVLAILEADRFGMSISQTLRSQSRDLRVRRRQQAEEMAIKTPVKMVFPLILCIFPATLLVVVGPAGIRIYTTLGGGG